MLFEYNSKSNVRLKLGLSHIEKKRTNDTKKLCLTKIQFENTTCCILILSCAVKKTCLLYFKFYFALSKK